MNQSKIKNLEGFKTIEEVQKAFNITRSTAIKYVHLLRKHGLVKTIYKRNKKRVYRISPMPEVNLGNDSFYDIINKYSPIKVTQKYRYRVMGKKVTIEESIINAIKSKNPKVILASLALFNHVRNWSLLYKLSKEANISRHIGALYELAKIYMKVKKIDKRTFNALLKSKSKKYIIEFLKSDDFKDIERKWNVYIPFNKIDLQEYKKWR